jgi:heparosan-N-sulfate-glucuronate 5-epimerase
MRPRWTTRLTFSRAVLCVTLVSLVMSLGFISFVLHKEATRIQAPISINTAPRLTTSPSHYWIDLSKRKYRKQDYVFDREGVPLFRIGDQRYYQPVYMGLFALGAYDYYIETGDASAKDDFLKCAIWLRDNLVKHGAFHYWEYNFPNRSHDGTRKIPWFSAMAQGIGVSVLVRAFAETRDTSYIARARVAMEPMFHDRAVGGISVVIGRDYIFPQEIPSDPPDPPSNILNGAISAYLGVYDYYLMTSDPAIKGASDIILKTLAGTVSRYDSGYWSLYCLWPGYLASPHYHALHIAQLKILYSISGDDSFLRYSERFDRYQKDPTDRMRFVVVNRARRAMRFTFEDVMKIPRFLKRVLSSEMPHAYVAYAGAFSVEGPEGVGRRDRFARNGLDDLMQGASTTLVVRTANNVLEGLGCNDGSELRRRLCNLRRNF